MNQNNESFIEGFATGYALGQPKHKHCINCDAEIPYNAEICPRCKARQPSTDW